MPKVTGRGVKINQPLTNVAIAYRPDGLIADKIFPEVPVPKQGDSYYVWNQGDAFRTEDDLRAPGTEANIITRGMSTDTYFCKNYALKDNIPYEDIKNADAGFMLTERGTRIEGIKDTLYLNWERRIALQVTSGANCGSYTQVASGWQGQTNGDAYGDVQTGINNVQDLTGYRPNKIVFGNAAWRTWRESDSVVNMVFGTAGAGKSGRLVNLEAAKALLEVDEILIGGAYYNSAEEGQTMSLSQIWNDNVLIYYSPMVASKQKPSFGYSFRWTAMGAPMQARVFQKEEADSERVQLGYYQDEKITASALSFLIQGVNSSQ